MGECRCFFLRSQGERRGLAIAHPFEASGNARDYWYRWCTGWCTWGCALLQLTAPPTALVATVKQSLFLGVAAATAGLSLVLCVLLHLAARPVATKARAKQWLLLGVAVAE